MESEYQHRAEAAPGTAKKPVLRALLMLLAFGILLAAYWLLKWPALDTTQFTLERQSASFLLVSTLKSSLAVIEGSDVGIGFRLEVGDIVQSTYDLVDFTWKMLLYGILLITFSKIFFESNLINIGLYILGFGFLLRAMGLFMQRQQEKFIAVGSGVIVAGLIVSFYIPVSTLVSFRACEYFVDHIEEDMGRQMEEVLRDWEQFKTDFSLSKIKSSVESAAGFMRELFLKLTRILITYTCLMIIRYLLFPMIVAYGFFVVSKAFLKKKLE
jgi:hypothetical protein